jgi:hypothetical protein
MPVRTPSHFASLPLILDYFKFGALKTSLSPVSRDCFIMLVLLEQVMTFLTAHTFIFTYSPAPPQIWKDPVFTV